MTIQEAIKMAVEYETRVWELYAEAAKDAADNVGKRVLKVLADEEKQHVAHLRGLLEHLRRTGKVTSEELRTVLPRENTIARGIARLRGRMTGRPPRNASGEVELLQKVLEVEIETGDFYEKMTEELGEEGRRVFGQFVEIERGHRVIVQAEIDHLAGTGYWFDLREFDLEGG